MNEKEYDFARLAVDKAKLSTSSDVSGNAQAKVAIVIEATGSILGWAAKGVGGEFLKNGALVAFDCQPKEHAEEALLNHLFDVDLTDATAYVTLEPCTERKKGTPCANRLAAMEHDFTESDLPFKVDLVDWATTSPVFRAIIGGHRVVLR